MQGAAGNCWVISGASALAERPAILNKVLPPGQTVNKADPNYSGKRKYQPFTLAACLFSPWFIVLFKSDLVGRLMDYELNKFGPNNDASK